MGEFVAVAWLLVLGVVMWYLVVSGATGNWEAVVVAASTAFSAFAAWTISWRQPDVRVIPAIMPNSVDPRRRLIVVCNRGALPTYVVILGAHSVRDPQRHYDCSEKPYPIAPGAVCLIPAVLVDGNGTTADEIMVRYSFFSGGKLAIRSRKAGWVGE